MIDSPYRRQEIRNVFCRGSYYARTEQSRHVVSAGRKSPFWDADEKFDLTKGG